MIITLKVIFVTIIRWIQRHVGFDKTFYKKVLKNKINEDNNKKN